jgi:cellulose synthase/poly-beta-1,6-N-acetylglucosamine synthase-like glycosyltransferase
MGIFESRNGRGSDDLFVLFPIFPSLLVLTLDLTSLAAIHILWTTLTYRARTADPKMRLRGDSNLPSVDVFIVASGQADQTVFDCAVAAASMDYPPHRYRVMVLDAGGSENLQKELARHAKAQACPHLSYHRRELGATGGGTEGEKSPKMTVQQRRSIKEDRIGNKANSINFGMMEASSFGIKGPAEYVAVFDADVRTPLPSPVFRRN